MNAVAVAALSGFPAAGLVWEAAPGQRSLTIIAKATFSLVPDELTLAPHQERLLEERNWDDNVVSSLHFPGDFAPSKGRVDVTLVGHAYTTGGAPATTLLAKLVVGELEKTVRVTGDRTWEAGPANAPTPGPPSPFVRMPLRYELAAMSADNPIGVDERAPPNLERVSGAEGTPCFGPIAPTWRARRRLCDEDATFWAHGVARDPMLERPTPGPAPARFDFAFFNAAPTDQQVDLLRPGTPLVLENLHPEHARLVTRLPKLRPQVFATPMPSSGGGKSRVEEIMVRCDSLWIDTDRAIVVLTWRGVMEVAPHGDLGTIIVAADPAGKKLRWAQVERWLGDRPAPTLKLGAITVEDTPLLPDDATIDVEDEVTADPLARRHDSIKGEVSPSVESNNAIDDALTRPTLPKRDGRTPSESRPRPVLVRQAPVSTGSPAGAPPPASAPSAAPAPRRALTLRKDLTLERCAEIAAALAEPDADRAKILRARLLTEASWALVDKHWQRVIAAEAERGERAAADAFDEAIVLSQENRARPIDLAAYARLTVGVERGEVGRLLGELQLQLQDLVRLQRVWARRVALSEELARDLARAVHEARSAP